MIADVAQTRDWIPLTNFTLCNLMAEGMLLALQMFPDELRQFPFDERQYLRSTMLELRRRQAMGVDVCPEMEELQAYAKKYPPLEAELAAPAKNGSHSVVRKLATTVGLNLISRRLYAFKQARKISRGDVKSGFHASGADFGFGDAVGCAGFISRVTGSEQVATTGAPWLQPAGQDGE
jgi:hypothetical protein